MRHAAVEGDAIRCRASSNCPTFELKESFIDHVFASHNDSGKFSDRKRLFCDFPSCYFVTEKSGNLAQHLRTHNDEKAFAW